MKTFSSIVAYRSFLTAMNIYMIFMNDVCIAYRKCNGVFKGCK